MSTSTTGTTTNPGTGIPTRRLVFNKVTIPVCFGLIGFIVACLLFNGNHKDHVAYQELVIQNKTDLVKQVLHHQLQSFRDSIRQFETISDSTKKIKPETLAGYYRGYNTAMKDSIALCDGNADSTLAFLSGYIQFHRNALLLAISGAHMKRGVPFSGTIPAVLIDSHPLLYRSPVFKRVNLELSRDNNSTMVSFFSKNTLFAFWLVFSIAQFTLWFMAVPLLGGLLDNLKRTVSNVNGSLNNMNWLLSAVVPAVFITIFCYLLYHTLIDVDFIKNQYFWEDFTSRIFWYAVAGYSAAVSCLAMFLLMSLALDQLDKTTLAAGTTLQQDQVRMNSFVALKKGFDNSFLAGSIILSLFVVWVGLIFQAVNHTEAMRLFSLYAGKPFLNFDFVYIIGAIHTLILFIFYFPVQLKFNSLSISNQAPGSPPGKKIWTDLLGTLSSIMVTASPLLAGILQHLISALTT